MYLSLPLSSSLSLSMYIYSWIYYINTIAQSAGAVEYTDYFSAEG